MTDIELNTLVYEKPEIDAMMGVEGIRVDTAISLKLDKHEAGAPSGVGTLDPSGKQTRQEIPFSTLIESDDVTNNDTVMSPQRVIYQINKRSVKTADIGVAGGIAPLGSNALVPDIYLPPTRSVKTYVVQLVVDMHNLPLTHIVKEGDRCVVTSDTPVTLNGEYVAKVDTPQSTDWDHLPNLSTITSVNGQTGVVDITTITESAANKVDITAMNAKVISNTDDVNLLNAKTIDLEKKDASLPAIPGRPDLNRPRYEINLPMVMKNDPIVPTDATEAAASHELATIGTLFSALNVPREKYELKGNNPRMKMSVDAGGISAQMAVHDVETNRLVATMEWLKTTQTFSFVLLDRNTGVVKNSLDMKQDGTSTMHGSLVLTAENRSYDHNTGSGIVIKDNNPTVPPHPDGWTPLAKIQGTKAAGLYEIKVSKTFQYNQTGKSAMFRWTLNGDAITPNWEIFPIEVKDKTNRMSESYVFPYTHNGGNMDIQLQAKREGNVGELTIDFANVIVERKG